MLHLKEPRFQWIYLMLQIFFNKLKYSFSGSKDKTFLQKKDAYKLKHPFEEPISIKIFSFKSEIFSKNLKKSFSHSLFR